MTRRILAVALLAALAARADEEVFPCDRADGFQTGPDGLLSAEGGNLVLAYEREKMAPLAGTALVTELKELRLRVRSGETGTFVAVLKDRDGATFNQPFALKAGEWTDVVLPAAKFALNHDSAANKPRLKPADLGAGWLILDAAAIVGGGKGRNELRVDEVKVVREDLEETTGDWIVDTEVTVARSRRHAGRIEVRAGGRLLVTAPRFVAAGELTLAGGTAEFSGGAVVVPQRFQHERDFRLSGSARLAFLDALLVTGFPAGLKLTGAQDVSLVRTECLGGFTCEVPPGARVTLTDTKSPGEFIIAPGGVVNVSRCENVILWHALGANLKGALRFPGPDVGDRWTSGHGLDVTVEKSKGIRWTLLSLPGAAGSVEDCSPMAAGLLFGGKSSIALEDVQDGRTVVEWRVPAPDRSLTFRNATVGAWNVYASDDAVVRVRKSTIGEAMTFGKGRIELEDTTVDGKGGYVGAHDDGTIRLVRCRLTCLAVARHRSRLELVECDVQGDVRATDAARVVLERTSVSGRTEADPGATLERK
ncbi:MAG: hypothetical protein IT452_03215 [Planctomycetia bacterium]|nr:hypothetical protein [Planctomycetia bacterium]